MIHKPAATTMIDPRRLLLRAILCLILVQQAQASVYQQRRVLASASIPYDRYGRRRRISRGRHKGYSSFRSSGPTDPNHILLASKNVPKRQVDTKISPIDPPALTYDDLTPLGKMVAGTVEVTIATLLEYVSGFFGGYFIGTVTDVPRLLFRPVEQDAQRAFFQEVSGRAARMHAKSLRWAKTFGGISAAFGGFRVATKVIRGGVEDEWNTIVSSMAAGAFFARNGKFEGESKDDSANCMIMSCRLTYLTTIYHTEGPQAMLRGAVVYGGLMYLLSGNLRLRKDPSAYQEEHLDF